MTTEPVVPSVGWGVAPPVLQADQAARCRGRRGRREGVPRPPTTRWSRRRCSGHKADVAFMALGPDWRELRRLQIGAAGGRASTVVDSYVSLTEVSEYATGMPEEMKQARLYPKLPPGGEAGVLLLPDVAPARGRSRTGTRSPYERARGADARARHVGPDVRRAGPAGHHRVDAASTTSSGASRCSPSTPTT